MSNLYKFRSFRTIILFITLGLAALSYGQPINADDPPNVLLVVADDLGFTDLGSFGSEISTPNLDALAMSGVRFTNFHSAATCSPTRAMLLSGTDHHIAGLGAMAEDMASNQQGKPGYEGYLNFKVVSVASILRAAGYHTYMTGKWHLGLKEEHSPAARGFERSFALLQGGAGHLNDMAMVGPGRALYREDGKLTQLPEVFYSTRFYVDKLIEYIDASEKDNAPFFAYLAFTAPHWPLQAPSDSIAKYKGKYDQGYDAIYENRMQRLVELGLMPEAIEGWPRVSGENAWADLSEEEKRIEAKKMEIYAAMVEDIDVHMGRLLSHLDKIGRREKTVIIFMSDNGPEGHHLDHGWPELKQWVAECCDNSYENMGNANSYIWYGPNWGRAGSGPYRDFKGFATEGGIRVASFVHYPKFQRQAEISNRFASVMDIMPTILDLANTKHPGEEYKGRRVATMKGRSLVPYLEKRATHLHPDDYVMGWELYGKRAIRQGAWKLVLHPAPHGDGRWKLYDLENDPSEQTDLASREPEKLEHMISLWEIYAKENGVILPNRISNY